MLNAKALRHAMIDADCSMKELAQVCKISPSALNRRMRGKVQFTLGETEPFDGHPQQDFFCAGSFLKETNARRNGRRDDPAERGAGVLLDPRLRENLLPGPRQP